jgi:adenylylsulfate kinase-like enzyme
MVVWFTGMSGAGKTTLCDAIYKIIKPAVKELVLLDGDIIRECFGNDIGYCEEDRFIQISRIQRFACMLSRQDLVVLVAALYAHPDLLSWNREKIPGYFEVYLKAGLDSLKIRNTKGLYSGSIPDVVGMDIPWHEPQSPDLILEMDQLENPEILAGRVISSIPQLSYVLNRI